MNVKAELKYLHIAPRKVRLVAGLVKGMPATRALAELKHLPKRSSEPLAKLIQSAIANAKHNFELGAEGLFIKDLRVNEGPVLKRFRPRAFGRAAMIRKRMSHVTLILETAEVSRRSARLAKKEEPVVREATLDEVKEEALREDDREEMKKAARQTGKKSKGKGFVSRMFRRKAI